MEPLWSPVVATGGNQRQTARRRKQPKQAKTVAIGCDQLPGEMVRRGSTVRVRQRTLQRPRKTGSFVFGPTCTSPARSGVEKRFGKTGPLAHTHPPPHGACP